MKKQLIIVGIIVILGLSLAGCQEENSSNDNDNISNYSNYENSEIGVEIEYPSTWNKYENPPEVPGVTVLFSSPSNEVIKIGSLMVTVLDEVNLSMEEFKEAHIENLSLLMPDYELILEESNTLSNLDGYKIIFTFTNDIYTWRQLEVWTISENTLYLLVHQADQAYYETFEDDIDYMIESFKIVDTA